MKTILSVYKKVKHNYKDIDIAFNRKEEYLIIKKDNLKIEADLDIVDLLQNNKVVTHFHPKNYDDLYNYISLFLDDCDSLKRKVRKDNLKQMAIIVIVCIILLVLNYFVSNLEYVFLYLGYFIIFICIFLIIFLLFKFLRKRNLLNKVNKTDLDFIKDFEYLQKDWGLALDYNVLLGFENIDFICMDFLNMKKKLCYKKKDIFDVEFEKNVMLSKNNELIEWYRKGKKIINCVYKYYDENGKRMI